jgi:hypothetical protein
MIKVTRFPLKGAKATCGISIPIQVFVLAAAVAVAILQPSDIVNESVLIPRDARRFRSILYNRTSLSSR